MKGEYESTLHIKEVFENKFLLLFFITFPPFDFWVWVLKSKERRASCPWFYFTYTQKNNQTGKALLVVLTQSIMPIADKTALHKWKAVNVYCKKCLVCFSTLCRYPSATA